MTAVPKNPRVTELRELFKQLLAMRATFEDTGLEEVVSPAGNRWSLWDLEYLFKATERLTQRQRQAITLCLVHGMRERDAAIAMGVSETNPVMMYASLGLQRLLDMIDGGELPRFTPKPVASRDRLRQHAFTLHRLVEHIEQSIVKVRDCWLFPTTCAGEAKVLVRSPESPLGYISVSPLMVMYERYIQPVPPGCLLTHTDEPEPVSLDCANPEHGALNVTPQRYRELQALTAKYRRMQRVV